MKQKKVIMARTNLSENENENENGNSEEEVILRVKTRSSSVKDTKQEGNDAIFLARSYSCRDQRKNSPEDIIADRDIRKIRSLLESNELKIWRYEGKSSIIPDADERKDSVKVNFRTRSLSMVSPFKHNSFLRKSFHSLWGKSFNRRSSSKKAQGSGSSSSGSDVISKKVSKKKSKSDDEKKCRKNSTKVLFLKEECFVPLNLIASSSSSSCQSIRSTNSVGFGIRSAPSSPMAPLQGQSEAHGQSVTSLNAIARSPSHHNTTSKVDSKSLKQLAPPVTASIGRSISPHPKSSSSSSKNDIPEKEKKRKELSSSRQKKFHRHFQQVSKDEKVINYFSCALVSDILLQGHLYITENYFAFYSNVFGFVTKLLIPTASVIRISKEKTAKIIPNAVGVATADERHVFGSFMSREAAFRLMCSVCQPLEPVEIIPKVPDVEVSEECSVEDDSSCSISGNESPPQILDSTSDASQSLRQRSVSQISNAVPDCVDGKEEIDIPVEAQVVTSGNCSTSTTPVKLSKSPPPRIVSSQTIKLKFPTDFHIVYLGIALTVVLALFSGFLLYRILDIEAKNNHHSTFKWGSGNDVDVFAEALKWQKEMQTKSTEEAQSILSSNLEQIARVRKSLETLSSLIHDKNLPSSNYDDIASNEENRGYEFGNSDSSIDSGGTT